MAASATDKFRKYKSLFSTTLSTGIGTGTSDTITPATVTGLPTDTGITLTIDRVDSSGTATPSKMERITGVISGGNLIDYVRGVDGTTEQAHSAGAVIEMVWNSADLNALIDGFMAEHSQAGVHGSSLVTTLKAAASDISAGTSDTTIATPKALKDAGLSLSTDGTLSDNSDVKVPSQKAVKTAIAAKVVNRAFTWYLDGTSVDGVAGATYIAPQNMTVTKIYGILTSGTCTATLKKGTTTIDSIACSNSLATETTITSAAITAGDLITLTISNASSPLELKVTMECTQP